MLAQSAAAGASPRARYLTPPTTSTSTTAPSSPPPPTAIGYFAVIRAIRASARLTSTERLVLLMISGHLDNATGASCPGMPKLAAECGLTTRTIERTIAALVVAGWLARESAASRWGTNVYRVTPLPDDVRAAGPRRLRARPFDRGAPDTRSAPPPSRVQATPDTRSGTLHPSFYIKDPVCSAPPVPPDRESTHSGFEVDQERHERRPSSPVVELEHEALVAPGGAVPLPVAPPVPPVPVELEHEALVAPGGAAGTAPLPVVPPVPVELEHEALVAALAAHPELRALARPPVAALLAAEGRPLPVVHRALAELAEHARAAAAVGEPWSAALLARKAPTYVRRAWSTPDDTRPTAPSSPPEPPPPPPRLAETAAELRSVMSTIGTGPAMRSTAPRRPPSSQPTGSALHLGAAVGHLRGVLGALADVAGEPQRSVTRIGRSPRRIGDSR